MCVLQNLFFFFFFRQTLIETPKTQITKKLRNENRSFKKIPVRDYRPRSHEKLSHEWLQNSNRLEKLLFFFILKAGEVFYKTVTHFSENYEAWSRHIWQ